jgi:uncharacterized protein (DUF302 family)
LAVEPVGCEQRVLARNSLATGKRLRKLPIDAHALKQPVFAQKAEERFVGESGFALFHEIDHGGWLPRFGINKRSVRWILGNPLIAITMLRHDITAGLFAPVEILVTEKEGGAGTTVTYVRPSSLMVTEENLPLQKAAKALDEKLDALIAKATGA